ncbi:Glomulin [Oryzias melastigma]|uniref:Glomulin n=1 Tax=Oryzias melastigma TaxID=30732 RepID=A0A834C4S5_ORYME|nr:Glomulin [Oryzias melastigma]
MWRINFPQPAELGGTDVGFAEACTNAHSGVFVVMCQTGAGSTLAVRAQRMVLNSPDESEEGSVAQYQTDAALHRQEHPPGSLSHPGSFQLAVHGYKKPLYTMLKDVKKDWPTVLLQPVQELKQMFAEDTQTQQQQPLPVIVCYTNKALQKGGQGQDCPWSIAHSVVLVLVSARASMIHCGETKEAILKAGLPEKMLTTKDQVEDVIQRWRDSQEEDLKPEDYQQFKTLGSACLAEGASEQLLKFVQEEKNQGVVKSMGGVLLTALVNEIVKKDKTQDHCQTAIAHLIKTCIPNKLLQNMLEMIEDIDPGAISETILVLLPHLQTACLPLHRQLSRLPVPYTLQQEEEDECGLCGCCSAMALFVRPFVDELRSTDGKGEAADEDEELKVELLKFCLRSLKDPLLEADLHKDRKSVLWLFAMEIMAILHAIKEFPSGLVCCSAPRNRTVTDSSLSRDSRACLAYLVFVELLMVESFPAVFSPLFLLQCNMEHIDHLLSRYALKNVKLVEDNSLPVGLMELRSFYSAPQNLRLILTDCPMRHLRESGLKLFQLFMDKLDNEAKHKFFRCMLKTSNHEGVESYVIKNIRRQIEFSIKSLWFLLQGNPNKWFLGLDLLSLLALVFILPHGAETNLLTNMDKIMEGLNLLRYVFLKGKEIRSNVELWEGLWRIKEEYLKMLRVALSMSRAYYSSELKALKEDQKLKAKEARDNARSGRLVQTMLTKPEHGSGMSADTQQQVLESALVTFDLMDSLTVRIEEITEETLS